MLEEAHRAVEFVQKMYDTYAEAWADQPLPRDLYEQAAAETDRFLAWTQLDRYAELALLATTGQPRAPKPGQQFIASPNQLFPNVWEMPASSKAASSPWLVCSPCATSSPARISASIEDTSAPIRLTGA